MKRSSWILYINRFFLIFALSVLVVWMISELGIRLQQDRSTARAPMTVELVIPAGTAAKVDAGQEPIEIPEEMNFVLGDVLVVRNEDEVAHTLGPLFVPAGLSATMPLNHADNFALTCSFKASKYLGLNVHPPTTLRTRLLGIAFAAPPTAVMLFVYSLVVFPVTEKTQVGAVAGKTSS